MVHVLGYVPPDDTPIWTKAIVWAEEQFNGYRRTEPEPIPVIPTGFFAPKRRALSFHVPFDEQKSKSPLLCLPQEIKDMIMEYVTGGMVIHWWIEERKLRGARCLIEGQTCQQNCRHYMKNYGPNPWPIMGLLGMLLSCRQMYSDTMQFMYTTNTFDTRDVDVVAYLPSLLPPSRLLDIQRFSFRWSLKGPPRLPPPNKRHVHPAIMASAIKKNNDYRKAWFQTWKVLAEMKGLVELRVELSIEGREEARLWEVGDLETVKNVASPKKFVLVLPSEVARRVKAHLMADNLKVVDFLDLA
ncbi:hypothetical protein B0J14DRAFT_608941 [Halenospora varia]|nr:hypothetical protein B0J14DRAFT_608941 [Halenospora varia]